MYNFQTTRLNKSFLGAGNVTPRRFEFAPIGLAHRRPPGGLYWPLARSNRRIKAKQNMTCFGEFTKS